MLLMLPLMFLPSIHIVFVSYRFFCC